MAFDLDSLVSRLGGDDIQQHVADLAAHANKEYVVNCFLLCMKVIELNDYIR